MPILRHTHFLFSKAVHHTRLFQREGIIILCIQVVFLFRQDLPAGRIQAVIPVDCGGSQHLGNRIQPEILRVGKHRAAVLIEALRRALRPADECSRIFRVIRLENAGVVRRVKRQAENGFSFLADAPPDSGLETDRETQKRIQD